MRISRITPALLLAGAVVLTACGSRDEAAATADAEGGVIATTVKSAVDEARVELAKENITISGKDSGAKVEITPAGDLLVGGRKLELTPAQRALVLDYRAQVVAVASAGMDVGVQGAGLAAKAVGEALRGVLSGEPEQIEARVEAEADTVRAAALKLCDHLPAMLASQRKLAAAVPEFAPHATMDESDIDDCRRDAVAEKPAPSAPKAPAAPDAPDAPEAPTPEA